MWVEIGAGMLVFKGKVKRWSWERGVECGREEREGGKKSGVTDAADE